MGDQEEVTLESQFFEFAKMMDNARDGQTITLSHSDYWLRQASILDDRKLTMVDTGNTFFRQHHKSELSYMEWLNFLEELCEKKGFDKDKVKEMLTNCGLPGEVAVHEPQYRDYFTHQEAQENYVK